MLAASPGGRATVSGLAEALGVSRAVVYRLLVTLEQHGLVRHPPGGQVRLGLGLVALARRVQPLLRHAAVPVLRQLAERTGATAHLTVVEGAVVQDGRLAGGEAVAVAVVEPSWTAFHVAYREGSRHALDRGAAGRAVLAGRHRAADPASPAPGAPGAGPAWVATEGELQAWARGIAAAVPGVPGLEASVGVVALAPLEEAVVGPLVHQAAQDVAAALTSSL